MSTEPETKKETKTEQDPKVASMLKALGYLDDPAEQAKLPADREAEETTTEEEKVETDATKPEGDAAATTEGDKIEEEKKEVVEEEKKETVAEEKVEDEKAKKVKREPEKKAPTLDEIADAVRGVVADSKKETAAEKKDEPKKDDAFRKQLHPAELKALELAEAAQKLLGDKYKNAADQTVEWIKKHREAATENAKRNDGKFDPNDEEYQQFVRANRPEIPQHDREEIFMIQAEQRAAERVKKEMRAEIEQRDRAIAELKYTPVIERIAEAVKNDVLSVAGEEFAKTFNERPASLTEEFPLEAPIVAVAVAEAVTISQEYMALAKQLKVFDKTNPTHNHIIEFIGRQGKELDNLNAAGKPFIRDGKIVLSRDKYYTMLDKGQDASRYTTFDDHVVVKMISFATKSSIEDRLKKERVRVDAIRASADKRNASKTSAPSEDKTAKKADEKSATPPPKGGTSPAKGAKGVTGSPKTAPAHMKALGYDMVEASKE
jgi:hypothetical protein